MHNKVENVFWIIELEKLSGWEIHGIQKPPAILIGFVMSFWDVASASILGSAKPQERCLPKHNPIY